MYALFVNLKRKPTTSISCPTQYRCMSLNLQIQNRRHEFIHINDDVKRYSYESQRVHIPFYKMIPQEIETYIKKVVLCEPYISEN